MQEYFFERALVVCWLAAMSLGAAGCGAKDDVASDKDPDAIVDVSADVGAVDSAGCAGAIGCDCKDGGCDDGLCITTAAGDVCAAPCADTSVCWIDHRDLTGKIVTRCKGARACIGGLQLCAPAPGKAQCVDAQCADAKDGTACDDGDVCTKDDACKAGACTGAATCECKTSADCAGKDGGNPCNGKYYCDLAAAKNTCRLVPGSKVTCSSGLDAPCQVNTCDKATGKCALKSKADGTACDDNKPCTKEEKCSGGTCAGTDVCACNLHDKPCKDDGNPCSGVQFCDTTKVPWTCKVNAASVVKCNSGKDTDCLKNLCDPVAAACAVTAVNQDKGCDDGDKCSSGETCQAGSCIGGKSVCSCQKHSDCADKDDGDLCNGTMFCDKTTNQCEVNPATIIKCKTASDTACLATSCIKAKGKCVAAPVKEGTVCFDGNPCTKSDSCTKGKCKGGINTCICQTDADCKDKDDGDLCNGTLFCRTHPNGNTCELNPASKVHCKTVDNTQCSAEVCQQKTGKCSKVPIKELTACDDGNSCTPNDTCVAGSCVSGANTCECQVDADCSKKDDGDPCNGTLYCDKSSKNNAQWRCKVNAATVISCPTSKDTACTRNQCDPKTGKCAVGPAADNTDCGTPGGCRPKAFCAAGKCEGPNVCVGCKSTKDCASEEDGNKCNGSLICDLKANPPACKVDPKTIVKCKDDDSGGCTKWACLYQEGTCAQTIVAAKKGKPCDDGDSCTQAATCQGLLCKGTAVSCDDKIPCTVDKCDSKKGCVFAADNAKCADGNVCTSVACDTKKGCVKTPSNEGGKCASPGCGGAGTCKAGVCSGVGSTCDDGLTCTDDKCVNGACAYIVKPACNDGNACTDDRCGLKGCLSVFDPPSACNDGNTCTDDRCVQNNKCSNNPNAGLCGGDGKSCKSHQCKLAKCVVTTQPRFFTAADATTTGRFNQLVVAPAGVIAVGTCGKSTDASGLQMCARLLEHTGKLGKLHVAGDSGDDLGNGATSMPGGNVLLVGHTAKTGGAAFLKLDSSGKVVTAKNHKLGGYSVANAVVHDGQFYLAAGHSGVNKDGNHNGTLWTLSQDLSSIKAANVPVSGYLDVRLRDVRILDLQKRVVIGRAQQFNKKRVAVIVQTNISGTTTGVGAYGDAQTEDIEPWAIAPVESDMLIAVVSEKGGKSTGFVARVELSGKEKWAADIGQVVQGEPLRFGLDEDAIYAVATGLDNGDAQGRLVHINRSGIVTMTRHFGAVGADTLGGIGLLSDGSLAMAGGAAAKGASIPWVLRTSEYGDTACTGKCFDKTAEDCDDDKGCTLDSCDVAKGCVNKKGGGNGPCDDDNSCTKSDVCQADGGCKGTKLADGAGCDDGSKCTVGDACKAGKCATGTASKCDDNNPCTNDGCDPMTGCTVAGVMSAGTSCGGGCGTGTCDNKGTCKIEKSGGLFSAPVKDQGVGKIEGAAAMQTGYVVAGTFTKDKNTTVRYGTVKDEGKLGSFASAVPAGMTTTVFGCLLRLKNGEYVLGGTADGAAGRAVFMQRLNDKAKPAGGAAVLTHPGTEEDMVGCLQRSDGGVFTANTATKGGSKYTWVASYSAQTSKFITQQDLPLIPGEEVVAIANAGAAVVIANNVTTQGGSTPGARIVDTNSSGQIYVSFGAGGGAKAQALVGDDKGFNLAGHRDDGKTSQMWMLRADLTGKEQWNKTIELGAKSSVLAFAASNYGFTLVGQREVVGKQKGALVVAGANGELRSYMDLPDATIEGLGVIIPSGDKHIVGGWIQVGGGTNGWFGVLGPFGHASCSTMKSCQGLTLKTCSDNKACTVDLCDAAKGCTNPPRSGLCDGGPCKTTGSCNAGKCEGVKDRLFAVSAGPANAQSELHAAASAGDGPIAVGATRPTGGRSQAWIVGYAGKTIHWERKFGGTAGDDQLTGVAGPIGAPLHTAVGFNKKVGGGSSTAYIVQFAAGTKAPLTPKTVAGTQSNELYAIAPIVSGELLAVGARYTSNVPAALIVGVQKDGTIGSVAPLPTSMGATMLTTATSTDLGAVAGGVRSAKAETDALLVWFNQEGEVLRARTFDRGSNEEVVAVANMSAGRIAAVTEASSQGKKSVWLRGFAVNGVQMWDRKLIAPGNGRASAAIGRTGEIVVLTESGSKFRLSSYGIGGTKLWSTDPQLPAADIHALIGAGEGVMNAVGGQSGATGRAIISVLGPWGHATCTQAGKCAAFDSVNACPPASCETGICTADTGCQKVQHSGDCGDGKACTNIGRCDQGKCTGQSNKLFGSTGVPTSEKFPGELRAAVVAPDGGVLGVGGMGAGAMVMKYGRGGEAMWTSPAVTGKAKKDELLDVTYLADGSALAVGNFMDQSTPRAAAVRIKDDGDKGTLQRFPVATSGVLLTAVVQSPGGTVIGLGQIPAGSGTARVFAQQIDATGKPTSGGPLGTAVANLAVRAAAMALSGSSVVWAGNFGAAGSGKARLCIVASGGASMKCSDYGPAGTNIKVSGLVTRHDNYYLAGAVTSSGKTRPAVFIGNHDKQGTPQILNAFDVSKTVTGEINALAPLDTGDWFVVGETDGAGGTKGLVARMTGSLQTVWLRELGTSGSVLDGAVVHSDNTVVGVGNNGTKPWIVRIDRFGNRTCGDSGNCADRPPNDCAPSQPCRVEACTKGACGAGTTAPDGMPCGSNKTCQTGVCK